MVPRMTPNFADEKFMRELRSEKTNLILNFKIYDYRAVYPLKNPAKPEKKSSGTKQIFLIGGVLMTIYYFQKNPDRINNLKDKFYASMICH